MTTSENEDFKACVGELGRKLLESLGCGTSAPDNTPDGQQLKNAIMGRDAWKAECEKERTVSKDLRKDLRERHEAGQAIIKTLETKLADSEHEREEAEAGFAEARLRANKAEAELVRLMVNTTEIVTDAKPTNIIMTEEQAKAAVSVEDERRRADAAEAKLREAEADLVRLMVRKPVDDANAMRAQLERERGHFRGKIEELERQLEGIKPAETTAKADLTIYSLEQEASKRGLLLFTQDAYDAAIWAARKSFVNDVKKALEKAAV